MCSSAAGSGYRGTCGSYFNAQTRAFPAVPYSGIDFNDRICKTPSGDIENYSDPIQVNVTVLLLLIVAVRNAMNSHNYPLMNKNIFVVQS